MACGRPVSGVSEAEPSVLSVSPGKNLWGRGLFVTRLMVVIMPFVSAYEHNCDRLLVPRVGASARCGWFVNAPVRIDTMTRLKIRSFSLDKKQFSAP